MKITGTFLDEISHDIPHQNWGRAEWDADFKAMKDIGIDTVILIRCGHRRWVTYPSKVLMEKQNCYRPPVDLVDLFLELAEKYGMKFYFGTYDSSLWQEPGSFQREFDLERAVIEEVYANYGHRKAFGGWYINHEISRKSPEVVKLMTAEGRFCKEISGGLPVMISPYIDGAKNVSAFDSTINKSNGASVDTHAKEWDEILSGLQGAVDIMAFQDGHCEFYELVDFMSVNKELATRYGMECWTNCESFDRDMPIKFLPIKWEKMLLKLEAARKAGLDKAITFEFSHFMSPNSVYGAAGNLYRRYSEYFNIALPEQK
ncbi:MAG: DUF4434 domain-containing protein [Lentisphaeria bacterium]|nr:DUF4434 domain-containing protein [Lentisphaeria bacterium]